ncbi:MAG: VTT domain-containing protein [Humidesulfovibrio sp.]|nr:VTT domain-containing protein [Humidesulfovibrio sp.]
MASNGGGVKPLLKGLALLLVLGGIVLVARSLGLDQHGAFRQWVLANVEGQGVKGVLFFVGVAALASAMGVPRQFPAFLGGYVFGGVWGGLLATLGTALGCALDFTLARTLGRELVLARFGKRVARLDAFLSTGPFRTSLAIRLFPVGHNLLTSVAAGVTSIPASSFILGSALGYVPQNLVFALFGAGFSAETGLGKTLSLVLSVVLLAASAWLGFSVYRAYKREGAVPDLDAVDDAVDEAGDGDVGRSGGGK